MPNSTSAGALLGCAWAKARALPARFSRNVPLHVHLALFAALLLIPAIVLASLLIHEFAADRRREAEQRLVQIADSTAERISAELERSLTILQTLSFSSALRRGDYEGFYWQAKRVTDPLGEIILLVNPKGEQLVNTARPWGSALPVYSSQSDLDKVVAAKQPRVTDLFYGRTRGVLVTNVLLPQIENGEVKTIMALSIAANRIQQWLQLEGVAGEWIIGVSDRNGTVIARSQEHERFAGQPLPAQLKVEAVRDGKLHAAAGIDGRLLVRATARTKVGGWQVAATVSEDHLTATVRNAARNLVLWSLGLLGLAALLVTVYGRELTAAFIDVSNAMTGKPKRSLVKEASEAAQRLSSIASELRQSEERFRGIFENAGTGIAITHLDGTFQACNPAYSAMLGYTPEELHGLAFRALVHPDDAPENHELMRKLHAREIPSFEIVNRYVGKGGRILWVHKHVSLLLRDDGVPTNVIALVTDMTERMRVEEQLRESETRFRATFENAAVGVGQVSPEGRWLRVNARLCEIIGYSADELTGHTFQEITYPDDLLEDLHQVKRMQAGEIDRFAMEKRYIRKDRSTIWVHLTVSCVRKPGGEIAYFIAVVEDIEERKRAEEHIQLLMREVNHRSKNMLSLVQAVARQTAARSPQEFISSFSDRLHALAASQDLLVRNSWKGVGLDELVRSQLAHFQDLVGSRISLSGPRLDVTASAAQTIGMAVHELATNAGKYGALSNNSGQVEIEWHVTGAGERREFTLCWIERGGPSVSEPVQPGFGSTVISRMARMSLGASSDVDFAPSGLRWRLSCPADRVLEGEPLSNGEPAADSGVVSIGTNRPKVLLVEDEALTAIEVAQWLSEAGFDVIGPASSVAQAFELLEKSTCEAAVLDVNLGRETSEPIAKRLHGQSTPFITVSGYARSQQPPVFRAAAALVSKPVRSEVLVAEVRKCLGHAVH